MAKKRHSNGAKKKASLVVKIVVWILLIVLLVGVFFAIKSLSNDFHDDIKTFYAVVDNQTITADAANLSLLGKNIQVYNLTGGGFAYEITSNKYRTFDFEINGKKHSFADKEVWTAAFDVDETSLGLTIAETDMETLLKRAYGDGELKYLTPMYNDVCYFTLVIKNAKDSSVQLKLSFFVKVNVNIVELQLDKTKIVF